MYTLLHGHLSPETAYTKDNYPYYSKTCNARWWVETNSRGQQRAIFQTQNPKTNEWNNPKPGLYNDLIFLYREEVTGSIHRWDLNYTTTFGSRWGRFVACGLYFQLNLEEKKAVRLLYYASQKRNPGYAREWHDLLNYLREHPEDDFPNNKEITVAKAQIMAEDHQIFSVCPY